MTPEILTVAEVAELLRTTPKAIYVDVERGKLPASVVLRRGSRLLFRRDALRAHVGLLSSPAPTCSGSERIP